MTDVDSLYPQLKTIEAMPPEMREAIVLRIQQAIDDWDAEKTAPPHVLSPDGLTYKSDFFRAMDEGKTVRLSARAIRDTFALADDVVVVVVDNASR